MNDDERPNTKNFFYSSHKSVAPVRALSYLAFIIMLLVATSSQAVTNIDAVPADGADFEEAWRVETERFPEGKPPNVFTTYVQRLKRASDMAVSSDGSIYQLCNLESWSGKRMLRDILLVKYNSEGEREWYKTIGSKGTYDDGECIAVDSKGNVYIAGIFGRRAFVASYASNGSKRWSHLEQDTSLYHAITVSDDSVYITGLTTTKIGTGAPRKTSKGDLLVSRFRLDGKKAWSKQFQGDDLDSMMWGLGIAVHDNKLVYVTGTHAKPKLKGPHGTFDNEDIFLLCLDSTGKRKWGREVGITPDVNDPRKKGDSEIGVSVVVDSKGNIYVAGDSSALLDKNLAKNEYGTQMLTLIKFNPKGDRLWIRQLKSLTNYEVSRASITEDDRILISGEIRGDGFVAVFNTEGKNIQNLSSQHLDFDIETAVLIPGSSESDHAFFAGAAIRDKRDPDSGDEPGYYFLTKIGRGDYSSEDEPDTTANE